MEVTMTERLRVAVIHALHDGIVSMYTGVGRVAANVVASFDQVRRATIPNAEVSLHLITTEYPPESPAYSLAVNRRSLSAVEAYDGTLVAVSTPRGCITCREIWGGPDRWRIAGVEAFDVAMGIAERYDRTFVFAHDIVFANLLNQLPRARGQNVRLIWIPHSTARIHRYGSLDGPREEIELEVAASINQDSRAYAGAIGGFMARHLERELGITRERIVAFANGLVVNRESYPIMTSNESAELLRSAGVPDSEPLVLFWGRAAPEKGVDILINAWKAVRSEAHLLVIASPETATSAFLQDVAEATRVLGHRATAVFHFDPVLPFAALSHPRTAVVVIPSRSEPCSLTAMEAKLYSRTGAFVTLLSAVDGLLEQAVLGGTIKAPLEPRMLAQAIDSALQLPVAKRREMAQRAHLSLSGWNFADNYSRGMRAVWESINDDVLLLS
jgi:glycosyltransferase involved in cell wall biosynthesis